MVGPGAAGVERAGLRSEGWGMGMGIGGIGIEDAVLIEVAKREGEPSVITVNCPDKTGLGCDVCRTILEFGLCISRGGNSFNLALLFWLYFFFLRAF